MSKPNITIPTSFGGVKADFDNNHLTNGFPQLTPDVLPGDCLNKFIDDTYKGLNGVLDLYNGVVLHDMTTTYDDKAVVGKFIENSFKLYRSLVNPNTGHEVTETEYWEEVQLGGATRNIGEIVASTIPLTDAGLHLLDGSLIQGSGIYSDFVDYIAGLDLTASYFCTEQEWQNQVTTYGVCGKFVYDSVNNTVRLPKVTGIIEGTTDVNALGDLVEAGLPNISGRSGYGGDRSIYANKIDGCFYQPNSTASVYRHYDQATQAPVIFDASLSNPIYGNSTTVQPQSVKVLYYIVIATSTKTDIQVNIDEVVTDLNGKADVDLSNCTKPHIVETYQNGTSWYRVWSDGWCEQGGILDNCSSSNYYSVSLIKAYSNTNYEILLSADMKNSQVTINIANHGNYQTTSSTFYIYLGKVEMEQSDTSGHKIYWKTCAFLPQV